MKLLNFLFFNMLSSMFMSFAKVEGPLFSLSASGKIGNALVFFGWKGKHVVRSYVVPANPKSTVQGYVRVGLKAIGKWVKKIDNKNDGDTFDSVVYQACTSKAPAGTNWNAFIGQGYLNELQANGTFQTTAFEGIINDYSSLGTAELAAFNTNATALGMEDLSFDYGYTTNIPAGAQLYFGAIACYKQEIIATAPYNTAPASWAVSDVDDFKEDMTTNA